MKRGHVLELDTDWESVGWQCPAYRCGILDFSSHLNNSSSNSADSAAPFIMPGGSTTGESYFASHGMFPSVTLTYTSDTGAMTEVNNGWEYVSGVDSSDEPTWTAFSGVTASDGGDPD